VEEEESGVLSGYQKDMAYISKSARIKATFLGAWRIFAKNARIKGHISRSMEDISKSVEGISKCVEDISKNVRIKSTFFECGGYF
jgi:hypothetical protein